MIICCCWLEFDQDHTLILDCQVKLFNDNQVLKFYSRKISKYNLCKLIIFVRSWLSQGWHSPLNIKNNWFCLTFKTSQRWATNHVMRGLKVSSKNYVPINLHRLNYDYTMWKYKMVCDFKFNSRWEALSSFNWLI